VPYDPTTPLQDELARRLLRRATEIREQTVNGAPTHGILRKKAQNDNG
jgi:hypothetical protein